MTLSGNDRELLEDKTKQNNYLSFYNNYLYSSGVSVDIRALCIHEHFALEPLKEDIVCFINIALQNDWLMLAPVS